MTHDARASMASLNAPLNVKEVGVGEKLVEVRHETEMVSSPIRCSFIRSFLRHLKLVVVDEGFGGFECPCYSADTQCTRSVCYHPPRSLPIP